MLTDDRRREELCVDWERDRQRRQRQAEQRGGEMEHETGAYQDDSALREILPKTGLVYSERGALSEIMCKPKIMPLKSAVLEKIQKIEGEADEEATDNSNFIQMSRN